MGYLPLQSFIQRMSTPRESVSLEQKVARLAAQTAALEARLGQNERAFAARAQGLEHQLQELVSTFTHWEAGQRTCPVAPMLEAFKKHGTCTLFPTGDDQAPPLCPFEAKGKNECLDEACWKGGLYRHRLPMREMCPYNSNCPNKKCLLVHDRLARKEKLAKYWRLMRRKDKEAQWWKACLLSNERFPSLWEQKWMMETLGALDVLYS